MQSPLQVPKGALEASMLKEIGETPAVLRQILAEYLDGESKLKVPGLDLGGALEKRVGHMSMQTSWSWSPFL